MNELSRFSVVITDTLHLPVDVEVAALKTAGIVPSLNSCVTEDDTREACKDADVVLSGAAPVSRRVIDGMSRCKLIIRCGTGYNTIDVEAASEKNILVCYLPDYCMHEVADHALALLMAMNRKVLYGHERFLEYDWDLDHLAPVKGMTGRTCGLLGFGRIGSLFAKRMAAFETRVLVYDPYLKPETVEKLGYGYACDLDRLLMESDFLSLHLPLTDSTRNIIGRAELEKMKRDAILINVSRGNLIDEEALAWALSNNIIGAAGIDVFSHELPSQSMPTFAKRRESYACPLMGLSSAKALLTPHTAWFSDKSFHLLKEEPCTAAIDIMRGNMPKNPVNLDKIKYSPSVWAQ